VRAEKYHRAALHRVALRRIRRRGRRSDIDPLFTALNRFCQKLRENAAVPFEFQRAGARRFSTPARDRGRIPPLPLPRVRRYETSREGSVGAPPVRRGEEKKNPLSFRPLVRSPTTIPVDAMARSARISKSHFPSVELDRKFGTTQQRRQSVTAMNSSGEISGLESASSPRSVFAIATLGPIASLSLSE